MILIHGFNPLVETLKSGRLPLLDILVQKDKRSARLDDALSLAYERRIPVRFAEKKDLDKAAGGANHQGLIGRIKKWRYDDLPDVLETRAPDPLFVVLDRVMDPHNLGAVIRTAECTGADAVIIPDKHAVGVTSAVMAASAGAAAYQKICLVKNMANTLKLLKDKDIWVIGVDAEAPVPWTEVDFTLPTAVVLGEEGHGMRRLTRENCDQSVFLPLEGRLSSINLSVAAGVILYEILRQRRLKKNRN
jgi:23S rRNA (guanosine2251-2'-O)-methyltransferase